MPQFTPLFESAGAELPLLTRVVITDRRGRAALLVAAAARAAGLLWLVRRQLRQAESRARIDRWLLRLPLLGELLAKIDTARLARTLGTLLGERRAAPQRARDRQGTLATPSLREALSETATAVKEGRGLAEPLARVRLRSRRSRSTCSRVGENSGHLDAMLLKIAEIFDREVRSTIERLMTLLVPVLTIVLGLIIAIIIGAVLAAILSAYQLPL